MQTTRKAKGEQTRAAILETALRLFGERGYEETTMRSIAEEAGVALGNAYYYFRSKDDLVHDFYQRLQTAQLAACEGILLTETSLKHRLAGTIRSQIAIFSPYRHMFASLFKIAADPQSPLNPFHAETAPIREACIDKFAQIVDGAKDKVADDLKPELPYLLWLYDLAVVLFWIYDRSPNQVRTYRLVDLTSELTCNLIALASSPLLASVRKTLLTAVVSLREI